MEALKTEFSNAQFSALYPKGGERYYWNIARNSIILCTLRKSGLASERMLEIGCGKGMVLRELLASGFDVCGVDLAEDVPADDLKEYVQYGVDFKTCDPAFTASIKVVLLFDVLEHIEHDRAFLESIRETFPNLTHIVITVPAHGELWSNFDTFNGHLRRYTRASLREVLRATGLQELLSSYFFHLLYIPARAFTIFGIKRRTEVKVPAEGISSVIHRIVARYFMLEYKIVPSFVRGTSIISVVKVNSK